MATDIDISHYNTGTATVAANGTAVTGQGTTWQGAVRPGDMFGTHKGDGIRILSVDSNTSLTLAYPWTGGAQTAAPYEIQRTPYDLGYQKAVEDFLEALQSGNLPVLASLLNIDNIVSLAEQVGESGTILGFSAPGVIKQIPLTSLILGEMTRVDTLAERDAYDDEVSGFTIFVLDADGNGRAALFWKLSDTSGDWSDPAWYTGATGPVSTVDVGTVTRVPFGEDPDVTSVPVPGGIELNFDIEEAPNLTFPPVITVAADQDAGAVVTPIAGGYSVQLSIPRGPAGDIDGVTPFWQGRITTDDDAVAARAGLGATSVGEVVFTAVDAAAARAGLGAEPEQTPVTQVEAETGTETDIKSWSPLRVSQAIAALAPEVPADVYRRSNILATVSQSGGVPTGGIIERGENANGEYVRYADGTQICWHRIGPMPLDQTASGNNYNNVPEWTFPAAFLAAPLSVISMDRGNTGSGLTWPGTLGHTVTNTSVSGYILIAANPNVLGAYCHIIAIGRWF